jgi:prophage DNA circulation protein
MSGAFAPPSFGAIAQVVGTAQTIDNSGASWGAGEWWQQLQPGSWRGVGFVLDAGQTVAGRRVALHEYAYRDDVWPEDLGKLPRRFAIQAFLVGDDVYGQRDAMLAACEQAGPGTLVHPTLGSIQVVLMEFSVTDRRDRGRYVEVALSFIVSGDVRYPATSIATGQAVTTAADSLRVASQGDLSTALAALPGVPQPAMAAVEGFTSMANQAVRDAGAIMGTVRGLQGMYGRFADGSLATLQPASATVGTLLGAATAARTTVAAAASTVNSLARLL